MKLLPRKIIYLAVCNYLTKEQADDFLKDLSRYKKINDYKFIKTLHKHFDIHLFMEKPYIKEDIWLFNYLMYQNKKRDDFNPLNTGIVMGFKGRLLRRGLITKYEAQIILPQYQLIDEINNIIKCP